MPNCLRLCTLAVVSSNRDSMLAGASPDECMPVPVERSQCSVLTRPVGSLHAPPAVAARQRQADLLVQFPQAYCRCASLCQFHVSTAEPLTSATALHLGDGKCVFILRGLPGSGKSSVAHQLVRSAAERDARRAAAAGIGTGTAAVSAVPSSVVTSADLFFIDPLTGAYSFDVRRLGEAHAHSLTAFLQALSLGVGCIIVDNTNVELWEYRNYKLAAQLLGYPVRVIEIACESEHTARRMQQRNAHRVTAFAQTNMMQRFQHDPEAIKIQPHFDDDAEVQREQWSASPARFKSPWVASLRLSAFVQTASLLVWNCFCSPLPGILISNRLHSVSSAFISTLALDKRWRPFK